jgi:hypothetical protein
MEKKYIIISMTHSSKEVICFWRADDSGYTENPWGAGIYTEEQVKANPKYYNNGYETVAVELTHNALMDAGLLIKPNTKKLMTYFHDNKG